MTKIAEITEEQKSKAPEWVDKWVKIGLSTDPIDFEEAKKWAFEVYKIAGMEPPLTVIKVDSPLQAAFSGAYSYLLLSEQGSSGKPAWEPVWASLCEPLWGSVGKSVKAALDDPVWDSVCNSVWTPLDKAVWKRVGDAVWDSVWDSIRNYDCGFVGESLAEPLRSFANKIALDGLYNHGVNQFFCPFPAYTTYVRDVLGWQGQDDDLLKIETFEMLCKTCGWTWWHEKILVISDRPKHILLDTEGRLHSEDNHSILYRDGWGLCHWHGTGIPSKWVLDKKPAVKELLSIGDIEQRRAGFEMIGLVSRIREPVSTLRIIWMNLTQG
jgi:hypothetical protein